MSPASISYTRRPIYLSLTSIFKSAHLLHAFLKPLGHLRLAQIRVPQSLVRKPPNSPRKLLTSIVLTWLYGTNRRPSTISIIVRHELDSLASRLHTEFLVLIVERDGSGRTPVEACNGAAAGSKGRASAAIRFGDVLWAECIGRWIGAVAAGVAHSKAPAEVSWDGKRAGWGNNGSA